MLMFQKMGTTDHDTLVRQFQTIVPGVEVEIAKFYLDANSWSLQNAIASFFEFGGEEVKKQISVLNRQKPQMTFTVKEDGTGDQCNYIVGTRVRKVWHIVNSGQTKWPDGCTLDHIGGETFGLQKTIQIPALEPSIGGDLALEIIVPQMPGQYHGSWMMSTGGENAMHFGEPIWVIISATALPPPQFGLTPNFSFQAYPPMTMPPPTVPPTIPVGVNPMLWQQQQYQQQMLQNAQPQNFGGQ
uniref:Nbr1 FW domain-containing protein n=1 Tax=Arcella intermedia TaxID=1963864 RepID=A0A6B2LFF1_9EUKA